MRAAIRPQPCQAGGLVLCACVNLPRAHSVSWLNLLPGRTHLFCILSVFSISNYLCHFFPLWKSCCDYYECSFVKVAENCLDGCTPAGGHENSWASGGFFQASLSAICILISLTLLPLLCCDTPSCLAYTVLGTLCLAWQATPQSSHSGFQAPAQDTLGV